MDVERCVGTIVCKMHVYRDSVIRGYIAMLAVDKEYRRRGIGKMNVCYHSIWILLNVLYVVRFHVHCIALILTDNSI